MRESVDGADEVIPEEQPFATGSQLNDPNAGKPESY